KPTIVANFGSNDFPSGSGVSLQVYNNELAAVAAARSGASKLLIYSLTNPSSPTLLGQTPLTVQSANDSNVVLSSVANGHAYTAAFWFRFSTPGNQVIQQFGETLDIDISNPAAPAVASVIYNSPPNPSTGFPDGTSNVWQAVAVNPQTLLLASTTGTA